MDNPFDALSKCVGIPPRADALAILSFIEHAGSGRENSTVLYPISDDSCKGTLELICWLSRTQSFYGAFVQVKCQNLSCQSQSVAIDDDLPDRCNISIFFN